MIAVALLLLATPEYEWLIVIGFIAIYVAALLTLWSMVLYLKQAWPQLSAEADK
jgi:CDP-diacylglycerol--glycerol-3-phosphate 3-phosphatidyltransferase